MHTSYSSASEKFSANKFDEGLELLFSDPWWHDDDISLSGPFALTLPCVRGWGESLLFASMLKRAVPPNQPVKVSVDAHVASLLKLDPAFDVGTTENARNSYRSPFAILKAALTGALLQNCFAKLELKQSALATKSSRPRVGIAWASIDQRGDAILRKSIPVKEFVSLTDGIDADFVSFQRWLSSSDENELRSQLSDRVTFLEDNELNHKDQTSVAMKIASLDVMLTISTTTAHIAGVLGVPTVLLGAKRSGPQWFWEAQRCHGKPFYPQTTVILGSTHERWWEDIVCQAQDTIRGKLNQ